MKALSIYPFSSRTAQTGAVAPTTGTASSSGNERIRLQGSRGILRAAGWVAGGLLALLVLLAAVWSWLPRPFDVREHAMETARGLQSMPTLGTPAAAENLPAGYVFVATLIGVTDTLLDKPGGYLANDVMPPTRLFVPSLQLMDNVPSWEYGVLVQVRDSVRVLRSEMSRSQSQSAEDVRLTEAEGLLFSDHRSWALPSAEGEYGRAQQYLTDYLADLGNGTGQASFHARVDTLAAWLAEVQTRLGSISQRLSSSRGKRNVDQLAVESDSAAEIRTPWLDIDDVFYETRGQTWALLHLMRAVELEFADALEQRQAQQTMRQIIRELERTQQFIWTPFLLNGEGFGPIANHSYTMAKYTAQTQAQVMDLRRMLLDG